ncbi:hypothetical protein AB1A81_05690 [Bdellovibrio bacteriovorus]|uniref:Uncharacterized protein n=1 Tax=Bdellovibrio bacteriovorus (strain ATCC 15356 / DSM 50701 / NCIMB 9529 / HD100) TaxID=264462 RepID=Q6MNK2_BDEBA|nr:hypothetical protein [Bdellovibrio bacteriovorus]CAE79149.1 hypothetical protein predicted by Glimmer/Critica [Bdellovibrio bacteriovorus HD100]
MKTLLLFVFALSLAVQAKAEVTSERFILDFIEQSERSLRVTNEERAAKGKRLYCDALNEDQVVLIAAAANTPDITVAEFTEVVSNELKCYPVFFPPWGRKGLGGTLVNTKAYVMDVLLVQDILKWMNNGRLPHADTPLLKSYDPQFKADAF